MHQKILKINCLGRLDYALALDIQKKTEQAVKTGEGPNTLILVEHPHTITLGRSVKESINNMVSPALLEAYEIKVFEINRGGKVTYHGPGQLVGYPIINLSPDRQDVHRYVRDIEEVLIRTLNSFNIEAFRIKGLTGVHTLRGKVAAIGVHISRWVTTHGFALNVNTDLSFFNMIIACEGEPVVSMNQILGHEVSMTEVEETVISHFAKVFEMKIEGT
jgi:lipoyl(octanoyl) transferase